MNEVNGERGEFDEYSDVTDIFMDVAKHRIVPNTKARVAHVTEEAILSQIIADTRQPASYMEKVD